MAKDIKMKFKLLSLSVGEGDSQWTFKIKSIDGFTDIKQLYHVNILVDNEYFDFQVKDIDNQIQKCVDKPDMFEDWKKTKSSLEVNRAGIEEARADAKGLEIENDFDGWVEVADFNKGVLTISVPEEVIPDIIQIRNNIEAYLVNLK